MKTTSRRLIALGAVTALAAFSGAVPAYAGGEPPPCDPKTQKCPEPPPPPPTPSQKCNAGNGNLSETASTDPNAFCFGGDPGGSFEAGNRGGDEGGTPVPNPGGNNVP